MFAGSSESAAFAKYAALHLPSRNFNCNYVWTSNGQLRSKSKIVHFEARSPTQLPLILDHGQSLEPIAMYCDPFKGNGDKLVLCHSLNDDKTPDISNSRNSCLEVLRTVQLEPMFKFEQDFTLFDKDTLEPLGWPDHGFPGPQGPYYCGIGANRVFGRSIVEAHYRASLFAGILISGQSAEKMLSQWNFSVGPSSGLIAPDELLIARFILHRVAEDFNVVISLDPRPVRGDWNGSLVKCTFTTKKMRSADDQLTKSFSSDCDPYEAAKCTAKQ